MNTTFTQVLNLLAYFTGALMIFLVFNYVEDMFSRWIHNHKLKGGMAR